MGAGLGPGASMLQMFGTVLGGFQAKAAADAAARVDDENARLTVLQGEIDAQGIRRDERMATGEMIAGQGGSGLIMGGGTLADMVRQNAYRREVDILNLRTKAIGEANALHARAAEQRRAGKNALSGALIGASATALTQFAERRDRAAVRAEVQAERKQQLGGGTSLGGNDIVLGPRVRVPPMRILRY